MLILIGYKKCSTCNKVEKLLKEKGLHYQYREIDKEPPNAAELKNWLTMNKQPITKWLNTSGQKYRALNLSQKRKNMSETELLDVIAADGMLVKRPILLLSEECQALCPDTDLCKAVLVGAEVKMWLSKLN